MPRKSNADRHRLIEVVCCGCQKTILRRRDQVSRYGRSFCSHACHMRFKNTAGQTVNVSGEEKIFTAALVKAFPALDIRLNDRALLPDGLEIDIHIPALRLAIELNGPMHFKPMWGADKLAAIQRNDQRKSELIAGLGYRVLVIQCDTAKVAKSQRAAFVRCLFQDIAKPAIEQRLAA